MNKGHIPIILTLILQCFLTSSEGTDNKYYGSYIGDFQNRFHNVQGEVFAVDSRTIFVKGFTYDGQGPDAFFYGGGGEISEPSGRGFRIPDEKGSTNVLGRYTGQNIVLTLPEGKKLRDLKWISVWCRAFEANFGEITFPERLDYPRPQRIGSLSGVHDVSSDRIIVVDAQTFLVPKFSYDGQAPDAHFWVGSGQRPGPEGTVLADENGSQEPLRRYTNKTLVVVLPEDLTVFDIDWFSVWCISFFADFGHVKIPKNLNIPPSLNMLGIEPQSKLNCEVLDLDKGFEVRWAIAGKSIVTQLVARLEDGEYMGFGLSGDPARTKMVGGDVTVGWMDRATGQGYAEDYYLDSKSQCAGTRGSCPDKNLPGGRNNVRLLNSAIINEFSMLTYRQPLEASDDHDSTIFTNKTHAVIWAIGPINSKGEVSYHSKRIGKKLNINFGRRPEWNCPLSGKTDNSLSPETSQDGPGHKPRPVVPKKKAWFIPPIPCNEPKDKVFFAQIGPTGGEQGYSAITGHVGWGIAWYINGLLIPEIHVVRGQSYTFVIEGGQDPDQPASFHPFYITDDEEGGYQHKSSEERKKVKVFAGVRTSRTGSPEATGTGRLCEWKEDAAKGPSQGLGSFGAYQRTLSLQCQEGEVGILQWTPDDFTPDLVYYQCFTHRFLGWKIHVHDNCSLN